MSTLVFIVACVVLALIVMSRLPGLEHFVKPIIDLLFTALKVSIENLTAWTIFLFKSLWYSHLDLAKHLMFSAESIDPSVNVDENKA